jgi:hypothetical protein
VAQERRVLVKARGDGPVSSRGPWIAIVVSIWFASSGCLSPDSSMPPTPVPAASVGAVKLQLNLAGANVLEISYTLLRAGSVDRTGTFIVDGMIGDFNAVIGALPPSDHYAITFRGESRHATAGVTTPCSGAATFGVTPGQTTLLGVRIRCQDVVETGTNDAGGSGAAGGAADSGSSGGSGGSVSPTQQCPSINAVRAVPNEAPVGKTVVLKSDVNVSDHVLYAWTSNVGLITDASAPKASFLCTEVGVATVTLKVWDDDAGCLGESVFVYVTCRDPGALFDQPAGSDGQPSSAGGHPAP